MSLRVQNEFSALCGTSGPKGLVLNKAQADKFRLLAGQDAKDAIFNCSLSFLSALQAIDNGNYSWSVAKLYYSLFYFSRAWILRGDVVLVYHGKTPYSLRLHPGESALKRQGNTHDATLMEFSTQFPAMPVAKISISGITGIEWLMEQRVRVHYTSSRFAEPECDETMIRLERHGIRDAVDAWLADDARLILDAADQSWAIVALPLFAISRLAADMNSGSSIWSAATAKFLSGLCRINGHPISALRKLVLGISS